MLNTENALLSRSGGQAAKPRPDGQPGIVAMNGFNDAAMLQKNDISVPAPAPEPEMPDEKEIYVPDTLPAAAPPVPAEPVRQPVPAQPVKPDGQATPKQPPAQPVKPAGPVTGSLSPDRLCQMYAGMFRDTLGLDISTAICFENMRRMCEIDVKDPKGTLFFLENTYRVSTLIYLASNLPILFVTSVLAEKNRKNILKYVTIEVENGSKPYAELLDLRRRRWMRKFENMAVNDAMTVTPGATMLTPELSARLSSELSGVSAKLRRFNQEMTGIVAKFDDGARNDIIYIYSNWWYLLQGFENVPEMRGYIMAVTDDTRKNLKI